MSRDYVAEHIMGFKRGRCQGACGGSYVTFDGAGDTWQWCDWCQREIRFGDSDPCQHYPFPLFTLDELMQQLGDLGHRTMLRYDPDRVGQCFTLVFDGERVCDTDEPFEALCDYLAGYGSSRMANSSLVYTTPVEARVPVQARVRVQAVRA